MDYVCNGVFVEWFTRNFIFCGMAVVAALIIILVFVCTERNTAKIRQEAQEKGERIQEEQERQARISEDEMRRKDDLIAYLAHDLKTALTSVIAI